MTNSQEVDRGSSAALGYIPLPRVQPTNPWQRALKWTWLSLLALALIVLIAGTSTSNEFDGSTALRPLGDGELLAMVALLSLSFLVALAHVIVLAIAWAFAHASSGRPLE